MSIKTGFQDLDSTFEKIDKEFLEKSRKKLNSDSEKNNKNLEKLETDYFSLNKELLALSGMIFGSSIALATGKNVNYFFVFGELFLFVSIVSGLIKLMNHLKSKEWQHAFSAKMSLDSYLLLNKEKIDKFELEIMEDLVKSYERIINSNQKGLIYGFLKKISIEKWQSIFNTSLIIGILLILISILPFLKAKDNSYVETKQENVNVITPIPTDIFYVPLR